MEQHFQQLRAENEGHTDSWSMKENKHRFTMWLKYQNLPVGEENIMGARSIMPRHIMASVWHQWVHILYKGKRKEEPTQNSDVRVDAKGSEGNFNTYYGYIDEIWELSYGLSLHIPIFKHQWVKHPQGVELDEYGFTLIDLNNVGHKDDPLILPTCVAQVFYVLEPEHKKKHVFIPRKQRLVGVDDVLDEEKYNQFDEVPFFVDTKIINLLETRISYSTMLPYGRTDANCKLLQG
jgi:hypothetical protein